MNKNQLLGWSVFVSVILAGVTMIWIKAGWTGNRVENSTFLALFFYISFALNIAAFMSKYRDEMHLINMRDEQRISNWLLRESIRADESGVRKVLEIRARELQTAYSNEAFFQQQRPSSDPELTIAWLEASFSVEAAKKSFWELVDMAKQAGLKVPKKVKFGDFIIDQDGAAT